MRNIFWTALLLLGNLGLLFPGLLQAQYPSRTIPYEVTVSGTPSPGCILVAPFSSTLVGAYPVNLMVMDSAGSLIWYAPLGGEREAPFTNVKTTDFKVLPNGKFAYWIQLQPETWYILDENFVLEDSFRCKGFELTDDHDLVLDEQGNYHLLCDTLFEDVNLSGVLTGNGFPGVTEGIVLYQVIQTQDSNHNVIRNWDSYNRLDFADVNPAHWTNLFFMDFMHTNSIAVDPTGELVISNRNSSEITRFDRETGEVLWQFGGKANDFTMIGDTTFFDAQHDANFTSEGNLYLFDNGTRGAKRISRYVEYEMDTVNMTSTLVREILHPFGKSSEFMGNAIHLEDDHVIVNWGGLDSVDALPNVTEFDENNNPVLDLDFLNPALTYRVYKDNRPWTFPRPELTCDNGTQTLSAPPGYAEYEWNTGDTTPSIVVSSAGNYQVWVDHGIGYLSSFEVTVTNPQNVCLALEATTPQYEQLGIAPNPALDHSTVQIPKGNGAWEMEVLDAFGRIVETRSGKLSGEQVLDLEKWAPGLYTVRVQRSGKWYAGKVLRQ